VCGGILYCLHPLVGKWRGATAASAPPHGSTAYGHNCYNTKFCGITSKYLLHAETRKAAQPQRLRMMPPPGLQI